MIPVDVQELFDQIDADAIPREEAIRKLIEKIEIGSGYNGSILYRLETLCAFETPLSLLVDIIERDVYEAREMALDILYQGYFTANKEERNLCRSRLQESKNSNDDGIANASEEAIEYI